MAEAEFTGEGLNSFLISQEAADDLWSIWSYVAEEGGVAIANRVESTIVEKILLIVQFSEIGHWRRDLTTHPVKFFPVYSYMIVYRPTTKPLQIVAILHGRRDVEAVPRLKGLVSALSFPPAAPTSLLTKLSQQCETAKLIFEDPHVVSFPERNVAGEEHW